MLTNIPEDDFLETCQEDYLSFKMLSKQMITEGSLFSTMSSLNTFDQLVKKSPFESSLDLLSVSKSPRKVTFSFYSDYGSLSKLDSKGLPVKGILRKNPKYKAEYQLGVSFSDEIRVQSLP